LFDDIVVIPQDFIQTLLGRVDIVDVIDKHVKLKKAGTNLVACCPFHSKQFYHCFGCGAHGSALGFLMEYTGASYVEAIETLAASVGMPVPQVRRSEVIDGQSLRSHASPTLATSMRLAFDYYRAQLKANPRAIDYFKSRGVSGDIAARFGLGYAPDGWQGLAAVFADYNDEALKDTGLVIDAPAVDGKPARRYDRFRDRVMFPIFDSRGAVIGFGGRIIGPGEPKYLNSPETPLFEKGRELYGLWQAKRSIRAQNQVIVVEGYMDVVALVQHGVENAVATLGTATTATHVQKLLKLADHVVFAFDGDAPGQKAAWRALETSLPYVSDGKRMSFLFLPSEDDPDTYVRREGQAGFALAVDRAMPLSELLVERLVRDNPPNGAEAKARLIEAAKPLFASVTAPILLHFLQTRLSEVLGVSRPELSSLMPPPTGLRSVRRQDLLPERVARRTHPLAARILAQLIAFPTLSARLPGTLSEVPELTGVAEVAQFMREADGVSLGVLLECFGDTEHARLISEACKDPMIDNDEYTIDEAAAYLDDYVARVARESRQAALIAKQLTGLTVAERHELAQLSM
jgi:DNA primase